MPCVLFPDAAQTLSCLRTSGLKLGMITAMTILVGLMSSTALNMIVVPVLYDRFGHRGLVSLRHDKIG
jgi:hypothetical protein